MTGDGLAISVIVPCYNAATYLGAAIESILHQDRPPFEIIVVDDGSTDGSRDVAAWYGSAIRCESQHHQGIGASRNRGVAVAQGDTIAFLDADDLWPQGSLRCRAERLVADPSLGAVYGRVEAFVSPEIPADARALMHCPAGAMPARLAGAMLVRRNLFDRVGAFDDTRAVGETMDWVARLEEAGVAMSAIDAVVLRRRIHSANTVTREKARQTDYLRILKVALDRRRAAAGSPVQDRS